ncbi:FAD-dependent oxidoreductase [Curtobacterium pusillum]|uniref:FAD-dependent oxidoreductase n=1 Tax=Curtobacterium pusillum TaxID=69373 RepID=A0ABX2MHT5_9MICO|nr:FAD-dependent oxidoreductase [Curtobacterium pusillum]NUU15562.1 FAD-dependent oxidoreductase [Curtobacterium pusillum]GLK32718.1 oxidoreductase [Curtobacterium pusillum]
MGSRSAVVIGSGIAGAATFFALARRGVDVTLVDDGVTGQATAASAGILQPWSSAIDGPFADLYVRGAAFWPEALARLADVGVSRTDHRRSGALVVNADPAAIDAAEERVERRRSAEPDVVGRVERIGGERARELFPPLATGLDALWIEGGGRVDGRTVRDALVEAGLRSGGRTVAAHAALAGDGRVRLTGATADRAGSAGTTDARELEADAIVLAGGAWTNDLLGAIGLRVPVAPQRGQITHLTLPGVDTTHWPSVHPLSHHYLVAFDGSRVAVGATRETGSGFDARVTAAGQLQVLRDALSIAPGLADATVIETRVGLRPLADDTMPIVGAVPGHDRLFVATGYGAAGLTMGPLLGDALARLVLGEPAPELAALQPAPTSTEPAPGR